MALEQDQWIADVVAREQSRLRDFGWREVTFWQALGLLALCRILFRGHGYRSSHPRRGTPEERERFRKAVRARFGFSPSTSESPTP